MKVMSFEHWVLREAKLTSWFSLLRTHYSELISHYFHINLRFMNTKKTLLLFLAVFCILFTGNVEAFVPQTLHLLHLVKKKIKEPVGLVVHQVRKVHQIRKVHNVRKITDTSVQDDQGVQTEIKEIKEIKLDEKLVYVFPGRLRSEILSGNLPRFYVETDSRFIKVSDGVVVSLEKSPKDFYTDILLYRDHESLLRQLILAGINTKKVTFQRFDNKICYFIGQPPGYQIEGKKKPKGLWIEKDSFFPVQYVIEKNGWTIAFQYKNWQRVSKTWYPMQISIFVDDKLFVDIEVQGFEIKSEFSSALFDVDMINQQYPAKDRHGGQEGLGKIDELDKQIEDFRKLYE
jgi:hypothetical protein